MTVSTERIIEGILFAAGSPVTVKEIADGTALSQPEIRKAIKQLISEYDERGSALEIVKTGPAYSMQVREDYIEAVIPFSPAEISRKVIKTATLIAYHQPVLQSKIVEMVGSTAYQHIRELRQRGLIKVRPSGRSLELTTTKRFLAYFGLDVKNTDELKEWLKKSM